jgi:uncharacterized protein
MLKTLHLFFFLCLSINAKDVPTLTGPVMDQANIYSKGFIQSLSSTLREFNKSTGAQLQVFTINNLADETIESYSIKTVDQWQLGNKKSDQGLLFLISVDDRKMRIEVGQGLEGVITDILAGRLIDRAKPYFKEGDYQGGTSYVMTNLMKLINGEIEPKRITKKSRKQGLPFWLIILIIIILFGRGNRRRSSWILYSGVGGGRSSSFGGGWSGGGGGFSGGGASGSW